MLSVPSSPPLSPTPPATTRPTVRTPSVPPPLPLAQSQTQGHMMAPLSPTPASSFGSSATGPTIPSYMQATKAFAGRSASSPSSLPPPPLHSPSTPATPTRTGSLASSVVSGVSSMSASASTTGGRRKPSRTSTSTSRAPTSDRSRSRPRATAAASPFTPAPDAPPPPPTLPNGLGAAANANARLAPEPCAAPEPPSSPSPAGEFPCASCRTHYTTTSRTLGSLPPAAAHPNKLYRHLLDLQISNDTLSLLNADLQATVASQSTLIHQLEDHLARVTAKLHAVTGDTGDDPDLVVRVEEEDDEPAASLRVPPGWYEPVSEDKIQDHQVLLGRMCDRTHRMLFDARRAVNRTRGDMEAVRVDDDCGSDGDMSSMSIAFSANDDDDDSGSIEIEADVVPKIVMSPRGSPRGRQMSTTSSIVSCSATSSVAGGQLHSLVKSLAYHIHLLDSSPGPDPQLLSPPPTRRTSSVTSSRLGARSPSPLALTRTPSGLGVLGLGAVLDLVPSHALSSSTPPSSAAVAAARKHQIEQCLVVQRCKDTVMQLCTEAGVPMREVNEMVVDAQMHVATQGAGGPASLPGSPTTASRLANPAVASRHPRAGAARAPGPDLADDDLVDIRSDASSTRSNYSRVSSSRSLFSSTGSGGGGGGGRAPSSVLGPNASASALGRAALVYPAGLSLEEKYLAFQHAQGVAQGVSGSRSPVGASVPRVAPGGSVVGGQADAASAISGESNGISTTGARGVRVKQVCDTASTLSSGSSAPGAGASSNATPSRVASVLSGLMPSGASRVGTATPTEGSLADGTSAQGSSTGRPRGGPGSMVARAIKVRTWMGS